MKKILVVDDDETIVDLLLEALQTEDRLIRHASDGAGALNWTGKETFDLIICDLMMPGGHGYQLIEQVKADREAARTKILVLTAKSFRRDAEKARQSGADLFMSKPFTIADLTQKVNQLLS